MNTLCAENERVPIFLTVRKEPNQPPVKAAEFIETERDW